MNVLSPAISASSVTTMFLRDLVVSAWVIGMGGGRYDRLAPLWISLTLFIVPLLPGVTALVSAWYQESPKGARYPRLITTW